MKNSCIYVLLDPRPNKNRVFYVGKSTSQRVKTRFNEHRTLSRGGSLYKDNKIKSIQNDGFNIEYKVIKENLSEEEAFDLEVKLIKILKYLCGFELTNGNDGGKGGLLGRKHTEEMKNELTKQRTADKNPMFGKIPWNKGVAPSEETKNKIKEARKNQRNGRQPILLFHKNGTYIEFSSKKKAIKFLNLTKSSFEALLKNVLSLNGIMAIKKEDLKNG